MRAHSIAKVALTLAAFAGFFGTLAISLIADPIPEGSVVEVVPFKTNLERTSDASLVQLISSNAYTLQ